MYCVYHTYVSDCISKRVKVNNGERNKYYIENNHPAIIDAGTFARVQEEIARRSGKPKVKQKGTKTELSRYSSKYALGELLICGECRTPYRRCTWTAKGKRKVVWRCMNRLDYGKKYCHHSPSIEESLLQDAVMRAIMQTAKQNIEVLKNAENPYRDGAYRRGHRGQIFTILDGLQNHPMKYDDTLVRQMIECVVVESKEKIKVVFIGGTEIEMTL